MMLFIDKANECYVRCKINVGIIIVVDYFQ